MPNVATATAPDPIESKEGKDEDKKVFETEKHSYLKLLQEVNQLAKESEWHTRGIEEMEASIQQGKLTYKNAIKHIAEMKLYLPKTQKKKTNKSQVNKKINIQKHSDVIRLRFNNYIFYDVHFFFYDYL